MLQMLRHKVQADAAVKRAIGPRVDSFDSLMEAEFVKDSEYAAKMRRAEEMKPWSKVAISLCDGGRMRLERPERRRRKRYKTDRHVSTKPACMDAELQTLVFGDGVPQIHNSIRKLYKIAPASPWLSKYLDVYSTSLQAATDHVPHSERASIVAKDLRELSDNHLRYASQNTAVTFLLTSGHQLGWLFAQLDSEPDLLQCTRRRVLLGFCMGLLPSLAAAISKDARTLLHVTPEIIRLSLELGLHLVRRANAVEQTTESWATVVFGMAENEALEIISHFHKLNRTGSRISILGLSGVSKLLRAAFSITRMRVIADEDAQTLAVNPGSDGDEIAIVGMAGRFPGAESLEDFWQTLEKGLDLHRRVRTPNCLKIDSLIHTFQVPPDRFSADIHYDPTGMAANSSLTQFGCFIDNPGHFDRKLFRMSPTEAKQTDPMQRLQLLTAYEALEMAGYAYDRTSATNHKRIGTFFGQSCDDYRQTNAAQEIDTFYIPGGARAFGPGRVSYHFGWEGPSYSIDTACSASIASIHLANQALHSQECDTAVVSAANILTTPDNFAGLTRGGFVSTTGACKTLDQTADGYCRADAVCTLVLKRLSNAIADNDNVHAVIKTTGLNSAAQAISITHPHAGSQADLFTKTLRQADLVPDDINHFELHGTGTQAGDVAETTAVVSVFAGNSSRPAQRPLHISAVKPNIGHSEAASGLTSLIKSVLMLRNSKIPPHVGIKTGMNSSLPPLVENHILVPRKVIDFQIAPEDNGKRRIMVNNLNAGGGNACIILEDPPIDRVSKPTDPRKMHVVAVSGATPGSLRRNTANLLNYVKTHPDVPISDLAYTTTARRMHHRFRKAWAVFTHKYLAEQLRLDQELPEHVDRSTNNAKTLFVFSGQGSQKAGMAKALFASSQIFKQSIESSAQICHDLGYKTLLDYLIFPKKAMLNDNMGAQLGLVAFQLALASMWQSLGLVPQAVIGHSLGEYSALCIAGALSVTDTFYLVYHRARLLHEHCSSGTHAMLSILASPQQFDQWRKVPGVSAELCCANSPYSIVVGGLKDDIDRLNRGLTSNDTKTTLLELPYAFHTSNVENILPDFAVVCKQIRPEKPKVPFGSYLLGTFIEGNKELPPNYLLRQTREPVLFSVALTQGFEAGFFGKDATWFEIGPSTMCLTFIKTTLMIDERYLLPSSSSNHSQGSVARSLAQAYQNGLVVSWSEYHRQYERCLTLLELPSYSFDLENYWIQYRGNWSLVKDGQRPEQSSEMYLGPTLHKLVRERNQGGSRIFEFETPTENEDLRQIVEGFRVHGKPTLPTAVYVDTVCRAAQYIFRKRQTRATGNIEVRYMVLGKPLVLTLKYDQTKLKTHAISDEDYSSVRVVVSSLASPDIAGHARCIVTFTPESAVHTMEGNILASIDRLQKAKEHPNVYRLSKSMVYQLFSPNLQYDRKYQSIQDLYLNKIRLIPHITLSQALANVRFEPGSTDDDAFSCHPVWLETLFQIPGFLANELAGEEDECVHVLSGWESLVLNHRLQSGEDYQVFATLNQETAAGPMTGDAHILHERSVVASVSRIKFRRIPKADLGKLLPAERGSKIAMVPDKHASNEALRSEVNGSSDEPSFTPNHTSRPPTSPPPAPLSKNPPHSSSNLEDTLRRLIASKLEVEASELSDHTNLADL
ncbi:MAG: hypothetical protein Q9212_006395, partial [Teloschistes hypoglaucus]